MSDLLREVDEDLRKERMMAFTRRYGPFVVGGVLLILAAVGGWQYWESYQAGQRDDRANAYSAAVSQLEAGDEAAALAAFQELAAPDGSDYALLATFEAARLKAESGDVADAVAHWRAVAESDSAPQGLRGVATLYAVMHRIGEDDPQTLQGELEPLTAEGSPLRATALELQAVLSQEAGDGERARDLYRQISDDPTVPGSARQRAAQMLEALEG